MTTEKELEQRVKELEVAYQELQKTKKLLAARTAVAWIGMVSASWSHRLAQQGALISGVLALLRHEVAAGAPIDKINRRIDMLDDIAQVISAAPMPPPLSPEEAIETVQINAFMRQRIAQLCDAHKDVRVMWKLETDDNVAVRVSPEWLRRAIDILTENALEAMSGTTKKVLTISTRTTGEGVEISLSDTGPGIPEEIRTKLFFEPIPKLGTDQGDGIGLLLASTIVQTYGGDIRVGATGSEGATMIISLPRGK